MNENDQLSESLEPRVLRTLISNAVIKFGIEATLQQLISFVKTHNQYVGEDYMVKLQENLERTLDEYQRRSEESA